MYVSRITIVFAYKLKKKGRRLCWNQKKAHRKKLHVLNVINCISVRNNRTWLDNQRERRKFINKLREPIIILSNSVTSVKLINYGNSKTEKGKLQGKHGRKRRKRNSLCSDNRAPMRMEFSTSYTQTRTRDARECHSLQDCERDKNEFKKNDRFYYMLYYFFPKV